MISEAGVILWGLVTPLLFFVGYRLGHWQGRRIFFEYRNSVTAKIGRLTIEARAARFIHDVAWLGKGQDEPTPEQALLIEKATIRVKALDEAARNLEVPGYPSNNILAYCALIASERWGAYDRDTKTWEREDHSMWTPKNCESET